MKINKEDFINAIECIKNHNDKIQAAYKIGIDMVDFDLTAGELVYILDIITNKDEWVSYFVYELEYGSKYKEGCVLDKMASQLICQHQVYCTIC